MVRTMVLCRPAEYGLKELPPGADPAEYEWVPDEEGESDGVAKEETGSGPRAEGHRGEAGSPEEAAASD
jgi:hypothetical protein